MNTMRQIDKLKARERMFEDVRNGKDVRCPKCEEGHLHCDGGVYFYCDNSECGVKTVMNYVH